MVMQVDQELCAGCGVCVDACSTGAIHLVEQRAEIDNVMRA
jgi:ferredoxin